MGIDQSWHHDLAGSIDTLALDERKLRFGGDPDDLAIRHQNGVIFNDRNGRIESEDGPAGDNV